MINIRTKSFILLLCSAIVALFAFQQINETATPLSQEAAIEARVQQKVKVFRAAQLQICDREVLKVAIPLADSLVAEMYARDLRLNDVILKRPNRPDRPSVDIEPFPFDSIEGK